MRSAPHAAAAVVWLLTSGVTLCAAYTLCALVLCAFLQCDTAKHCLRMASYFAWPFERALCVKKQQRRRAAAKRRAKKIEFQEMNIVESPRQVESALSTPRDVVEDDDDDDAVVVYKVFSTTTRAIVQSDSSALRKQRRGVWQYHVLFFVVLVPVHTCVFLANWLSVFFIPSAKLARDALRLLAVHGTQLEVRAVHDSFDSDAETLLYVPYAAGWRYVKHCAFDGFNVCMFNMASVVIVVAPMALGLFADYAEQHPLAVFALSLAAMVPLAYFVGLAVERIAEQSTPGMASFLNSSVGSVVDTIFTASAMLSGNLTQLVKATMIGSLLLCLLLFPGISMLVANVRNKASTINATSTNVFSELLLLSAFAAFMPTLFYYSYGSYRNKCDHCTLDEVSKSFECKHCIAYEVYNSAIDSTYADRIRPLTYLCSIMMPLVYVVSLVYTLRTHSDRLYGSAETARQPLLSSSGDGDANFVVWSKLKCYVVLTVSIVLFSLVSITLTNVLQRSADLLHMSQQFMGVTIVSIAPSITELISCVRFSFEGKLALSFEVSITYASQMLLVQFPALVCIAAVARAAGNAKADFTMLFEPVDVFCVLMSIFILNFVTSHSSQTTYVEGALLCAVWVIIMGSYWFSEA